MLSMVILQTCLVKFLQKFFSPKPRFSERKNFFPPLLPVISTRFPGVNNRLPVQHKRVNQTRTFDTYRSSESFYQT